MEMLEGKVAIVTGAARGMGGAEPRLFAAEGARVVLTDIDMAGAAIAKGSARRRCLSNTTLPMLRRGNA